MPDIVPNEINFETTIVLASGSTASTVGPIVKLDFPLLVSTSDSKRVVNVITDVEYDFPPGYYELNKMALNGEVAAPDRVYRDWVLGLYREEPTSAQVDPGSSGSNSATASSQITLGNPGVIDRNVYVEMVSGGISTTGTNSATFHGSNVVRKNLQYMGIGTVVPNSYVWLVMRHARVATTQATAVSIGGTFGNGAKAVFVAEAVRIGCRIKYVQTTIPLSEWVGLYFSSQQIGDV